MGSGGGERVISGLGECTKNMEDQVQEIKTYDSGVENGDLTFSQDRNAGDTLEHCEDTVVTVDFWVQITTYFSSLYTWTEDHHLV